jgi:hypothetical protein
MVALGPPVFENLLHRLAAGNFFVDIKALGTYLALYTVGPSASPRSLPSRFEEQTYQLAEVYGDTSNNGT